MRPVPLVAALLAAGLLRWPLSLLVRRLGAGLLLTLAGFGYAGRA